MKRGIFIIVIFLTLLVMQGCRDKQSASRSPELTVKALNAPAIEFSPREYICYRTEKIKIDGQLNEEEWLLSDWTTDFVDIEGNLKPAPAYRTRAKILWDDQYLYIAAEIEEPNIWARLSQRDTVIYYDNDFEVFIDPDGDTHGYYEIELNSYNTVWDLLLTKPYRDGGRAINAWDLNKLQSAVTINGTINDPSDIDSSWIVEIALPFESLKELGNLPSDGTQWRINFSRVNWQTEIINGKYIKSIDPSTGKNLPEYNWVWSPQGIINMHYPEMWGYLQFSDIHAAIDSVNFNPDPDKGLKWYLRNIYYAERKFASETGRYSSDLISLDPGFVKSGTDWEPVISLTSFGFEAVIKSEQTNLYWVINNEGRIFSKFIVE